MSVYEKINMRMQRILLCALLASVYNIGSLYATSIDTTTASNYYGGQYDFSGGDSAKGFITFKDGFSVPAGTVTYDAQGLVAGTISLIDGSILKLQSDLCLSASAVFSLTGTPTIYSENKASIHLNGDLALTGTLRIGKPDDYWSMAIDGGGHKLDLTDAFVVLQTIGDPTPLLTLKNMDLVLNNLSLQDLQSATNTVLVLEDVNVFLNSATDVLLFNKGTGNIIVRGLVRIFGPGQTIQMKLSANTVTSALLVDANSMLYVGPGVTLDLSNITGVSADTKIKFTDATSSLWLDGCTLKLTNKVVDEYFGSNSSYIGLNLQKGNVYLDNQVYFQNLGQYTAYDYTAINQSIANSNVNFGFIFGDGVTANNNTDVNILGGAYVVLEGTMYCNNLTS